MAAKYTKVPVDGIFEEQIAAEIRNDDERTANCDSCCLDVNILIKNIACFLCFVCNKYYCEECFIGHDESHKCINMESEEREKLAAIDVYMEYVKGESERGRKLMKYDVCVCDFVDTKHGLDKGHDCFIRGLCGTPDGWVVCDYSNNSCIKLFTLGTNVLQRYIRFGSRPWDLTEILEKQNSTEVEVVYSRCSNISAANAKPDRKSLLAVTLPWERLILIIDLSKNPAEKVRTIKMEKVCWGIEFYDGKIFTACEEAPNARDTLWSVCIMSTEGVELNIFNSAIPSDLFGSYLTVLNGKVFMTDPDYHTVYCFNAEGRVLTQITIEGSGSRGICEDRSNNKVFVTALYHHRVYELDNDLGHYKSVLDQSIPFMRRPEALCFYRNKLYVGHFGYDSSRVTVIRFE